MTEQAPQEGELILYRTADDAVRIEVLYEHETFWLDQRRIAELFGVEVATISYHLKEIYASGELERDPTLRRILRVQREGNREVRREIEFYNLDAVISVGYRVNSSQATQFRIWATQTLREFIVKGFVLDDERLKLNKRFGKDYFDELLERIRETGTSTALRGQIGTEDLHTCCAPQRASIAAGSHKGTPVTPGPLRLRSLTPLPALEDHPGLSMKQRQQPGEIPRHVADSSSQRDPMDRGTEDDGSSCEHQDLPSALSSLPPQADPESFTCRHLLLEEALDLLHAADFFPLRGVFIQRHAPPAGTL